MLLRIGYLLRGVSKKTLEKIAATLLVFLDNNTYTADTININADNDSNII